MKNKSLLSIILLLALCVICTCLSACDTEAPTSGGAETTANEQPISDDDVTTAQLEITEPESDGSLVAPDYSVSVVDGVCYLNFTAGNGAESNTDVSGNDPAYTAPEDVMYFASVAEMKQAFLGNTLTAEQQAVIKNHYSLTENGYELCNLDALVTPVTPEGFSVTTVYLYGGTRYTFSLRGPGEITASGYFGNADKYEQQYDQYMESISKNQLDSHTTETYDGVACESYVITTSSAQVKIVFMTIPAEGEGAPIRVMMKFLLQSESRPEDVSATAPQSIYLFGEAGGIPYDYLIHGMTEAPTVEWLSSFAIEPYEDAPPAEVS